jgi:hypothetical protein
MDRGPTLAISSLFAGAMLSLLSRITSVSESDFYALWSLLFGFFIFGVIVWGYRCGIKKGRKLITILCILFATISFVMNLSVGFFLLLKNTLYFPAYLLFAAIISWEVVSEVARKVP